MPSTSRAAVEVDAAIDDVVARLGPVGILVNNAGVSLPAPIDADGYEAAWELTLAVNLTGLRAHGPRVPAAPARRGRRPHRQHRVDRGPRRHAVHLALYGEQARRRRVSTRSLAVELGAHGVTVNCVCPGPINTAMTAPIPDEAKERFARRRVPLRRYGEPEEVAHMVLNLALPASSFVNGAVDHRRRRPVVQVRVNVVRGATSSGTSTRPR